MKDILKYLNIKPTKTKRTKDLDRFCKHLKNTYTKTGSYWDIRGEIQVEETFCSQCNKMLNAKDLEQIKETLKKFKK